MEFSEKRIEIQMRAQRDEFYGKCSRERYDPDVPGHRPAEAPDDGHRRHRRHDERQRPDGLRHLPGCGELRAGQRRSQESRRRQTGVHDGDIQSAGGCCPRLLMIYTNET